jgi:hypothetical protein
MCLINIPLQLHAACHAMQARGDTGHKALMPFVTSTFKTGHTRGNGQPGHTSIADLV